MHPHLTYEDLASAVDGGVAAIRSKARLQPAGGPGDKIFPPTYASGERVLKYAIEARRIDGDEVPCVLLDSVASQANRMEEALLRAWDEHELPFPVIGIDFSDTEVRDLDRITTLHAPHRVFDALLRDSVAAGDVPLRDTSLGEAITAASVRNATALYSACPTALVWGAWDSTGPKGGLGTKFQRALVSEIVAINAVTGKKTASRLDPAGIQANVEVYHHKDDHDDYTIDPELAERDSKGRPLLFSRRGAEGKGKPSAINHSNVAPSIDEFAGGITFDYALQTTVVSLPALRRLRFQMTVDGRPLTGEARPVAERSARTALAGLALAAIAEHRAAGFDLRSRCALVPEGPLVLELVDSDGGEARPVSLTPSGARDLLMRAHEEARAAGMGWEREPIRLTPAPKLASLIARSRAIAAGLDGEDAG